MVIEPELRQLIRSVEAKLHLQRPEHLVRQVRVDKALEGLAAASRAPGERRAGLCGARPSPPGMVLDVELLQAQAGLETGTRLGRPQRRGAGGVPTAGTSSAPKV